MKRGLHPSLSGNAAAVVAILTSLGTDVNVADNNGRTPLHDTACLGPVAAIKTLLAIEPTSAHVTRKVKNRLCASESSYQISLSYNMAVTCLKSEGANAKQMRFFFWRDSY
eukprot:GDKK01040410.1.p1 GENE.GDKK01040410.1~~GDKK01040410.1.p1  ORF type:complete len:111 (-),score=3.73 GDKK01040410.1:116-448(-)